MSGRAVQGLRRRGHHDQATARRRRAWPALHDALAGREASPVAGGQRAPRRAGLCDDGAGVQRAVRDAGRQVLDLPRRDRQGQAPAVDHDHKLGCGHDPERGSREVLARAACGRCNELVAGFTPESLLRAVQYLANPPAQRMRASTYPYTDCSLGADDDGVEITEGYSTDPLAARRYRATRPTSRVRCDPRHCDDGARLARSDRDRHARAVPQGRRALRRDARRAALFPCADRRRKGLSGPYGPELVDEVLW